jgi:Mrp family chromosome partitioning ATPase
VNWGELDYLILDLPPGTGDEPLSVAQNIPSGSHAIIVTTPQEVSILDVGKSLDFARQLKMKIVGVVENMSGFACPHCGESIELFGPGVKGGGENLSVKEGVPFLGSIPIDPAISGSGDSGSAFMVNHGDSMAGKAFTEIVDGIRTFLGDK